MIIALDDMTVVEDISLEPLYLTFPCYFIAIIVSIWLLIKHAKMKWMFIGAMLFSFIGVFLVLFGVRVGISNFSVFVIEFIASVFCAIASIISHFQISRIQLRAKEIELRNDEMLDENVF